jgi:NAD kinase
MVVILLIDSIFEKTSALFNILEINTGSKQFYHNIVILDIEKAINSLLEEFWNVIEHKLKIRIIFIYVGC